MAENNPFAAFFLGGNGPDLVSKAKIANDLAKMAEGVTRAALYGYKDALVSEAIVLSPHTFTLTYYDERGMIGVRHSTTCKGFHVPARGLTADARAALAQQPLPLLSHRKEA